MREGDESMKSNTTVTHTYVFDRSELEKTLGLKGRIISVFGSANHGATTVEILTQEEMKA